MNRCAALLDPNPMRVLDRGSSVRRSGREARAEGKEGEPFQQMLCAEVLGEESSRAIVARRSR